MVALNGTLDHMDLTAIYRTFQPKEAVYIFWTGLLYILNWTPSCRIPWHHGWNKKANGAGQAGATRRGPQRGNLCRKGSLWWGGSISLSERSHPPSASDILNLIPSDERIILPNDDEPEPHRVRLRPAHRMVQLMVSEALSQSSRRSSRYLRSMSGTPNLQENLKERQTRVRDVRENQKLKTDHLYKYIFEILSENLGLDMVAVEE